MRALEEEERSGAARELVCLLWKRSKGQGDREGSRRWRGALLEASLGAAEVEDQQVGGIGRYEWG